MADVVFPTGNNLSYSAGLKLLGDDGTKLGDVLASMFVLQTAIGNSAVRNIGTTTGTVAAGDDSRIVGAVQAGTLGNAAIRNIGTTANTVAAGDDSRIAAAMVRTNNLSDVANTVLARTNLGIPARSWPARRLIAGTWEWPAGLTQTPAASALAANQLMLVPFDLTEPATIGKIGWYMANSPAAAGNLRFGLYSDDGIQSTFTLIAGSDAGEIAVATSTGAGALYSPTFSVAATIGRWYIGMLASVALTGSAGAASTTQCFDLPAMDVPGVLTSVPIGFRMPMTYGPMPATITGITRVGASSPRIGYPAVYIASTP